MPALPRTHSLHSPLVRCLEGLGVTAAGEGERTVAEHLGDWLAWTDAIALFDVLQGGASDPAAPLSARTAAALARSATDALRRERIELARAIAADPAFAGGALDAPTARHHCNRHQQVMEDRLGPLRAGVRQALAAQSPDLARLAALDASMERILAGKARQLLSRLPTLLEQPAPPIPDTPRAAPTVDGQGLRAALLAELDLRLQTIEGMVDALGAASAARSPAGAGARS